MVFELDPSMFFPLFGVNVMCKTNKDFSALFFFKNSKISQTGNRTREPTLRNQIKKGSVYNNINFSYKSICKEKLLKILLSQFPQNCSFYFC